MIVRLWVDSLDKVEVFGNKYLNFVFIFDELRGELEFRVFLFIEGRCCVWEIWMCSNFIGRVIG